jgi:predicted AlkP superfamily pyrophosphatase or phosphodiesterase
MEPNYHHFYGQKFNAQLFTFTIEHHVTFITGTLPIRQRTADPTDYC